MTMEKFDVVCKAWMDAFPWNECLSLDEWLAEHMEGLADSEIKITMEMIEYYYSLEE